jgi:hypothetical protein
MTPRAYHLTATLLPDGDEPVDLWLVDSRITFRPQNDAEELFPAGGYALAGLVDCHTHITMDFNRTGLPLGSLELVAANRRAHLTAGVLLLREAGSASPELLHRAEDGMPRFQPSGRILAAPGTAGAYAHFVTGEELVAAATAQAAAGAHWAGAS